MDTLAGGLLVRLGTSRLLHRMPTRTTPRPRGLLVQPMASRAALLELPGDLAAERIGREAGRWRNPARAINLWCVKTRAVLLVIVGLAAGCRSESTQSAAA